MPRSIIRVERKQLGGKEIIDVRRWREVDGHLVPTTRGVSIPQDELDQIMEAMRSCGEFNIDIEA